MPSKSASWKARPVLVLPATLPGDLAPHVHTDGVEQGLAGFRGAGRGDGRADYAIEQACSGTRDPRRGGVDLPQRQLDVPCPGDEAVDDGAVPVDESQGADGTAARFAERDVDAEVAEGDPHHPDRVEGTEVLGDDPGRVGGGSRDTVDGRERTELFDDGLFVAPPESEKPLRHVYPASSLRASAS